MSCGLSSRFRPIAFLVNLVNYEVKFVIHLILPSIFFLLFVDGFVKLEGEGWSKGF